MKIYISFVVAAFTIQLANAQFAMSPDTYNGMAGIALNAELNRVSINTGASRKTSSPKTKTTKTSLNISVFRYTPESQVSAKVKQNIIKNEKRRMPNTRLEEALSDQNNPFPRYIKLLNSLGLDARHNYADAFTAYLLGMWRIANGIGSSPTSVQINAVRNQVVKSVDISNMDDVKKQEAAEYMLYELIFSNEPYEGARRDGDMKQQKLDSDAVHLRFLTRNKMNLRKMSITENGLVFNDR